MHTLIVTAHPEENAYTHAVTQQAIAGIEASPGHTFELINLSQTGFDPRFTKSDYDVFRSTGRPGPDVLAEQARLDKANSLLLIFPVYWWSMPAVMKGWIDRVFTQGWAYIDHDGEATTRLLGRLTVQIIAIGGAVRGTYERRGYSSAMQTQLDEGIFGYVGAKMVGSELILPLDANSSEEGLIRAFEIGNGLQSAVYELRCASDADLCS